MEGSEAKPAAGIANPNHVARTVVVAEVLRFAFGAVFIVMGAGLLLEGAVGSRLFLEGVNRVFEFYVGMMSVALGAVLIAGMRRAPAGS